MPTLLPDIELLERLVAFASVTHESNRGIAGFLAEYLARGGGRIIENTSEDGEFVNVVAIFGEQEDRRGNSREGLTLSAHLDVVPADEAGWKSSPFELGRDKEKLVARGVCDMKGFVALACNAAIEAHANGLVKPVAIVLTYGEERGSIGAGQLAETFTETDCLPQDAIVGEPTSLRIVRMHKGHLKMRVRLAGQAAHSGYPHLGASAIEPAGPIICALNQLGDQLATERCATSDHFQETPFVTLNIGRIAGGGALNVIPAECVVEIGVRPLPGMNVDELVGRVRDVVLRAHSPGEKNIDVTVEVINSNPPLLSEASTNVCQSLMRLMGTQDAHAVSFASDAGHLQRLGCECVLWGPGNIERAHQANEWISETEWRRGGDLLRRLLYARCGVSSTETVT